MVVTRSASSSPVKKSTGAGKGSVKSAVTTTAPAPTLKSGEPLRIVIAPKTLSCVARFISLSNSTSQQPERFLFCPELGLHELKRTSTHKHELHSILFTSPDVDSSAKCDETAVSNGYVNKSAEYLTATPYDLCFAVLPLLTNSSKSNLFQTVDDIVENPDIETYDLPYILQKSRSLLQEAILRVCDVIEAGDESLYRYSSSKTLQLLIGKARRACKNGLPASLEDRYVTRVLEAPMLSVKREESTISLAVTESQDAVSENLDSQSTTASVAPSVVFSETSVTTTTSIATTVQQASTPDSTPTNAPSSDIVSLQRLLTAFKFVAHSYLSPFLASTLLTALQEPSSQVDFSPLNTHLTHIVKLRAEAAASLDLSSFSRKRGLEDDMEAEERADKKKKLEEEEKRKRASQSRGVAQLSKVDVKGMKKMSSFFTKMPAKGKS